MRMVRRLPLLAVAVTVGCAHYPQEDGEKLANEVYAHTTQLQALQKSLREGQDTVELQGQQLDAVQDKVESLSRAARRNDADLGVQVDNVLQELAKIRGLVESGRERLEEIEGKVSALEEEIKIGSARSEEDKQKAIADALAREQILSNPEALVGEVIKLINEQKAEEARKLLREFQLRAKSNRLFKRYAADAQYLIGETFYVEGDYKRAATEYNAVRKKYPKSKKHAPALYKLGQCFEKLKLPNDAKLFYTTLRKQFPKSSSAKKARARLKELK